MDFLLSLSSRVKEKLAGNAQNKSVIYVGQVLSDEDVSAYQQVEICNIC